MTPEEIRRLVSDSLRNGAVPLSPVQQSLHAAAELLLKLSPLSTAVFACEGKASKLDLLEELEHVLIAAASHIADARRAVETDPVAAFKPAPPQGVQLGRIGEWP